MKKTLTVLAIILNTLFTAHAQNYRPWATYYGSSDVDIGTDVTTDVFGNVYLVGYTDSNTGLATAGAYQTTSGGNTDAFIVKFNSSGARLWATYYGGANLDYAYGVKTDAAGNVYVTGYTTSTNGIATAGTQQTTFGGGQDVFLVKFSSSGVRLWGTYYGGSSFDWGSNVAVDFSGNVYITGYTPSTDSIASAGSYQDTIGGADDAFLAKFNGSNGTRLWGTYFGGISSDRATDIATDSAGNVFIGGYTMSPSGIASPGAYQTIIDSFTDGFVAKFNAAGNRLWATYFGGPGGEQGNAIATGAGGCVYFAGNTTSTSGIASGGFQNTHGGGISDAYLVKFNAAGSLQWSTYYGGNDMEEGEGVATDTLGNVFLSGDTYSQNTGNCIATPNGFQTTHIGMENSYLVAFNGNGVRLNSTYYGNVHEENCRVAANPSGSLYIAGYTPGAVGISSNGFQNTYGGNYDGFLVKFSSAVPYTDVIVPNNNLPPSPPIVTLAPVVYGTINIFNDGGISFTNAVLRNFSNGVPLPASGSATITFTADFSGIYSDAGTHTPVSCTANVSVHVTLASVSGATRVYDTEMLQLDLSGSTLPSGLRLRESPTLASTGQTVITDIGGGKFRMSSFFDVFTELSTDGGQTWRPNTASPPARLVLRNENITTGIPTLNEWGLIVFSVLMLGFAAFFIRNKVA